MNTSGASPALVHFGAADVIDQDRQNTLTGAYDAHPERFATSTDPKLLALHDNAWINQPAETLAA